MDKFSKLFADILKLWGKYGGSYLTGMRNTLILALIESFSIKYSLFVNYIRIGLFSARAFIQLCQTLEKRDGAASRRTGQADSLRIQSLFRKMTREMAKRTHSSSDRMK